MRIAIHEATGRERICEEKLEKLREMNEWIAQYKQFWTQKLDVLESYPTDLAGNSISDNKISDYEEPVTKNIKRKGRR